MTKYWLHRITGGDNAIEFAHPLLFSHNYLSIGWSDFSDEAFLENIREHGIDGLDEEMQNRDYGLPKNRWNLWRFIIEMKKGDIVVVPTWGEFSLFELVDDIVFTNESMDGCIYQDWNDNKATLHDGYYYNCENKIIDLGFYRKVKPLLINIPRDVTLTKNCFQG